MLFMFICLLYIDDILLIHFDLCGPMHVPSANENKYIMYLIDDYTKMYWAYLLKDKSQDFEIFKNIHV